MLTFSFRKIFSQMEILEMLAMAGADLNAKNKNEETPSGNWVLSKYFPTG